MEWNDNIFLIHDVGWTLQQNNVIVYHINYECRVGGCILRSVTFTAVSAIQYGEFDVLIKKKKLE